MKIPNDEKFPVIVSENGVTAKIHKVTRTKNGNTYVSYVADYILLGKRKQTARADFEDAKQVALDACRKIANGQQISLTLTNHERLVYLRATETLAPTGIALDAAATEFASAIQILGGKATIVEVCRDWMKRNLTERPRILISAAVEQIKAEAETEKKSDDRQKQLANVLDPFAERFNVEAHTITPALISTYLIKLPLSERSKKNHRDVIGFFNRWLVLKEYLPKGTNWLEGVQKYSAHKSGEIQIYTVEELPKLLNIAGDMTPFIAIGAFAGLRHAEIKRLDWSEVDLEDGFIEVRAPNSKNWERRLVPIHDNLKQWLLPYKKEFGAVVPYKNTNKQIAKIAKAAGIKWKRNALRHSFISYRVAECADVPRVADEAGNSPTVIRKNYLRRVKPVLATQWFGIVPIVSVISIPATNGVEPMLAQIATA